MRLGAWPLSAEPALRFLRRQGMLDGGVLAVVAGGRGERVFPGGLRATVADPRDLDLLRGRFRTAIDVGCAARLDVPRRIAFARRLADLVDAPGFLHVVAASRRPGAGRPGGPTVPQEDLAATFRRGWSLLGVRDLWSGGRGEGQHAWLASFARVPAVRQERPVVRSFTDLGAFGSLDLGAATDRPPWGS